MIKLIYTSIFLLNIAQSFFFDTDELSMKIEDKDLIYIVTKVNDIFYDKVYEDDWLKYVFENVDIDLIKSQQTDFIVGVFGGPKRYCGRSPKDAHPHIFIQDDMWDVREKYLIEAFEESRVPQWMREKWIDVDNAFKKSILNASPDECVGRYRTEQVIIIPNPANVKKAA